MRRKIQSNKFWLRFTNPEDNVEFKKKFYAERMQFITRACLGMAIFGALLVVIQAMDCYFAITRTPITDEKVTSEMQGEAVLFHGASIPRDEFYKVSLITVHDYVSLR